MNDQLSPVVVLRGHEDTVTSVLYLNQQHVISSSSDGKMKIWKYDIRRCSATTDAHQHSIQSIGYLGHTSIATSGRDGLVKLWDLNTLSQSVATLRTGCNHFCNASTDRTRRDLNTIASATTDITKILVWDIREPTVPVSIIGLGADSAELCKHGMVTSLLLHSSLLDSENSSSSSSHAVNPSLLAGYEDGSVSCFDLRNTSRQLSTVKPHSEPVFAMDVSPAGTRTLVTSAADSTLQRYRLSSRTRDSSGISTNSSTAEDTATVDSHMSFEYKDHVDFKCPGTSAVQYRPDGRLVVSCHWDGAVRIFDSKRMKPIAVLRQHRVGVNAVDFLQDYDNDGGLSSNSAKFATASKDCTVAIWDVFQETFKENKTLG